MQGVIDCFSAVEEGISSATDDLNSNDVLGILRPCLEKRGFRVEAGKTRVEKIDVPVYLARTIKSTSRSMQMPSVVTVPLSLKSKRGEPSRIINS